MAGTEKEQTQSTVEPTISVEEIQKTIDMGVQSGKIKKDSLPRPSHSQSSTNLLRTTSDFFLQGISRFRYLFGYPESKGIPSVESDSDNSESLVSLSVSSNINIEELNLGLISDDFQHGAPIASGGQADIINAKDKQIGRVVAVKCLRDTYKENPAACSNLMQEAILTARLEHPTLIPVYRLCRDTANNLHIVMKKIRGKTLGRHLEEIRMFYNKSKVHIFEERASLSRRLDIFLDICNGLSYAHSQKVVHCDLKPDNIMIGFHRETYIIDWGIAKVIGESGTIPGAKNFSGTPYYIAPEVVFGMDYDRRADIFAMGSILFEIVTLKRAFAGKDLKELLENICTGNMNPIKHLHGIGIDKALIHIIRKATSIHPDTRYQRIEDLAEDIRRYRSGLEILAKPDNIFQYACRWMFIHKKLTRWVVQIFLVIFLGFMVFNIYEKMQIELQQKRRETSLNSAYTKSLIVVMEINNLINKTEQIVSVLASQTAFILDHHPFDGQMDKNEKTQIPFVAHHELANNNPPSTSILSMRYNSRIDFTNLSFINSGKLSEQELEHYIQTFLPFKGQIIGFYILSCTDKIPYIGKEASRPENMEKANYSLLWLYIDLAKGLHLRYPATESYGAEFDGRSSLWYTQAEKNPDVVIWEQPHLETPSSGRVVLTAAKAIVSLQQKFFGVASAEIPLDEIRRIMEKDQSDRYFKKMLLLSDGRILINTANPIFQPKNDKHGNLILPQFHQQELFNLMKRKKFGFERVWENGRETFYIYSYLEQMKWYYVVRVDQDTIRFQEDWKISAADSIDGKQSK